MDIVKINELLIDVSAENTKLHLKNMQLQKDLETKTKLYDKAMTQLVKSNGKIMDAINYIKQEISSSSVQYEKSKKQQDLVYKVAHERILSILEKEAENEND